VAVQGFQDTVDLTPPEHPNRAGRLHDLAISFGERYKRLEDLKDLEAALQKRQESVELTPPENPDRAGRLQSLAVSFTDRFRRLGDLQDLEAAMQGFQDTVRLTPPKHPDRAGHLQSLALSFTDRFRRLGKPEDLAAIHMHYDESFRLLSGAPESSWEQALIWADFNRQFQPSKCIAAFQAAFQLLPEILWIGHSIPVRHDAIQRLNIPEATSAVVQTCINLSQLPAAVEMLEQGVATIFQQMLELKPNVNGLPPHQAKDLFDVSSKLYSGILIDPISIVEDRKKLLGDIRNQPGFEYFLLPKSYDVLRHASQGGPVIILNSHPDCCDAIILPNPTSNPVHVPLHNVTPEVLKSHRDILKDLLHRSHVRNRGQSSSSRIFAGRENFSEKPTQECFEDMLNWLWTNVVRPVYRVLKLVSLTTGSFTLHLTCPLSLSMIFMMGDSGGSQQVHLQDCLCMQAQPKMNSFTHTHQL
jgi:tetratricopeptide (TPR) repeat protein